MNFRAEKKPQKLKYGSIQAQQAPKEHLIVNFFSFSEKNLEVQNHPKAAYLSILTMQYDLRIVSSHSYFFAVYFPAPSKDFIHPQSSPNNDEFRKFEQG